MAVHAPTASEFWKIFQLVTRAPNSQGFLPKERAKGQTAVAISLAQVDARAQDLGLDRRPSV